VAWADVGEQLLILNVSMVCEFEISASFWTAQHRQCKLHGAVIPTDRAVDGESRTIYWTGSEEAATAT